MEGRHGPLVPWSPSLLLGLPGRPPGRLSSRALQAPQAPSLGQPPGALRGKCPDPDPQPSQPGLLPTRSSGHRGPAGMAPAAVPLAVARLRRAAGSLNNGHRKPGWDGPVSQGSYPPGPSTAELRVRAEAQSKPRGGARLGPQQGRGMDGSCAGAPGRAPPPSPARRAVLPSVFVSLAFVSLSLSLKLNGIQLLAPCVFCSWLSPFHYY